MNSRGVRRYVDDLLHGRRPKPFAPDDFEAAQVRTAIELQAARMGSDAPRREFLTDLHRRLAEQMHGGQDTGRPAKAPRASRRQVIVGTSAAAAAVAAGVAAGVTGDRLVAGGRKPDDGPTEMRPNAGSWQVVATSSDVPEGVMRPFDTGSVVGFVRRVNGQPEAISGVCTHQGCKLWFDGPDELLRCPCHLTSFTPSGQVATHALPIAPRPLPRLEVRELNGSIEVLAPNQPPTQPA